MKLPLSTELLFLIPLALALASGFFLYGIIIGLSIASALLYHFKNEKNLEQNEAPRAYARGFILVQASLAPHLPPLVVEYTSV